MKFALRLALSLLALTGSCEGIAQTIPREGRPASPDERRRLERANQRLENIAQQAQVTANQYNVSLRALRRALQRALEVNPEIDDAELVDLLETRARQAADAKAAIDQLRERISTDPYSLRRSEVEQLLATSEQAFDEGRFDDARTGLARVRGLRRQTVSERRVQLQEAISEWLSALDAEARIAYLQSDYRGAADIYLNAMREESELTNLQKRRIVTSAAEALEGLGIINDDLANLDAAIALFRDAIPLVSRNEFPREWAQSQVDLAFALRRRAEVGGGSQQLREAVEIFQTISQVVTDNYNQNNEKLRQTWLGDTLFRLFLSLEDGEDQPSNEISNASAATLQRAISAYRRAAEASEESFELATTYGALATAQLLLAEYRPRAIRLSEVESNFALALHHCGISDCIDHLRLVVSHSATIGLLAESTRNPARLDAAIAAAAEARRQAVDSEDEDIQASADIVLERLNSLKRELSR